MLAAARRGRTALLQELGAILVEQLTWADVVINHRGEDGVWHVVWTSTTELSAALQGETYTDAGFEPYLVERFQRRGTYFVPAEEYFEAPGKNYYPQFEPADVADAWQVHDELFVPLRDPDRRVIALLNLGQPLSGRRPTDTELDVLMAVAEHAALAFALLGEQRGW
jgi:GAF domain-containing protein